MMDQPMSPLSPSDYEETAEPQLARFLCQLHEEIIPRLLELNRRLVMFRERTIGAAPEANTKAGPTRDDWRGDCYITQMENNYNTLDGCLREAESLLTDIGRCI